ncbi:MAG: DedA family protein [Cyanobacteria bacterium SIG30]|nr:DedA family protein [Cyanobacteria bacterium SIG30]
MSYIINFLKGMTDFFAQYGTWGLFLNSFTESFFIVPPPDALLILMDLAAPSKAIWYAFVGTIASALGGVVGYGLGYFIGRPAFNWFFKVFKSKNSDSKAQENFEKIEQLYDQYGSWAVFFAAFTPIPYKLFTIASGILKMNLFKFFIASIIGRGGRFFLVSICLMIFGPTIKENIELVIILTTIAILIFFFILYKKRHSIIKPKQDKE